MVTVSVKRIISAIEEADAFQWPDMDAGADYLCNNLYRQLSRGEDVRLSGIDYDSFELDDIDSVRELYSDTLQANEYKAGSLTRTLGGLPPVVTAAAFV